MLAVPNHASGRIWSLRKSTDRAGPGALVFAYSSVITFSPFCAASGTRKGKNSQSPPKANCTTVSPLSRTVISWSSRSFRRASMTSVIGDPSPANVSRVVGVYAHRTTGRSHSAYGPSAFRSPSSALHP